MRYGRILVVLSMLGSLGIGTVSAQALPDLAPRDVEIRGDLTIAFPSLRRQPLIGFNPPPRVPEIDVRRMPYVESYKQQGAELPQNPLRNPTAPRALAVSEQGGFAGTAEAGVGRYGTRYALLEASLYSSPSSRWTLNADYSGTSSYAPFGIDNSADGFSVATGFSSAGRVSYGITGSASTDSYALYGVGADGIGGALAGPDRTRSDLDAGVWIGSGADATVAVRLGFEGFTGRTATDILGDAGDPIERDDSGVEASLSLAAGPLRLDGTAGVASLGTGGARDLSHYDTGGSIRARLSDATSIEVGGRVLGFEAQPAATRGERRVLAYFSPSFQIEYALAPHLRLEITQLPSLTEARPSDLFGQMPYLDDSPHSEPEIRSIDATARLRGFWGAFQASLLATAEQSPNWRVFEHDASPNPGYARGVSRIRHRKARVLGVGGEIRLSPRPGFEARFGARLQNGRMTDLDADLPYLAPWTIDGLLSTTFSGGKGLVQLTSSVQGPRSRDAAGTLEVATYADLDVRLSYAVTRQALAVLELRNMLGENPYWDHYPIPPATILLGIGWRW